MKREKTATLEVAGSRRLRVSAERRQGALLEVFDATHAVEYGTIVVGHSTGAAPHFGGEVVGEAHIGCGHGVLQHGGRCRPEIPGLVFVLKEVTGLALIEVATGAESVET